MQMFKLEDVTMGIWINEKKKESFDVTYENDEGFWWKAMRMGMWLPKTKNQGRMMCL